MNLDQILETIETEFKGKAKMPKSLLFNPCVYLNTYGQKCAIGLFIPDGHEGQDHEGNVHSLLITHPDLMSHLPFKSIYKLKAFQKCHDDMSDEDLTLDEQKLYLQFIACYVKDLSYNLFRSNRHI